MRLKIPCMNWEPAEQSRFDESVRFDVMNEIPLYRSAGIGEWHGVSGEHVLGQ
jgi:hypothetical protein